MIELEHRDADVPLSSTGEQQARAVRDYLRTLPEDERPTAVASSPYRRARQTAEYLSDELGMPVEQDPRPTLQTHEGYEWLYVLDGRLRLVLALEEAVAAWWDQHGGAA